MDLKLEMPDEFVDENIFGDTRLERMVDNGNLVTHFVEVGFF